MNSLTVMIAPCQDLLGPSSRVRLVSTRSKVTTSALDHYRRHATEWVEIGEMRARSSAEIKDGHYWKVVCIDPAAEPLSDELEHALSPATFKIELPESSKTGEAQ